MITVYLANDTIQVVSGKSSSNKVTVDNLYYTVDTEQSIINGTITNEEEFCSQIKDFWVDNKLPVKDVALVINSTKMATKSIKMPKMAPKKTMAYIANEFSDVEREGESVFGCYVLEEDKKTKMRQMFAATTDRSFIDNIIRLFDSCGIKITSVETSLGSAVRLLQKLEQIKNRTCIVQLLDNMDMTSILFVDGKYTYSNRKRLFNERATIGFSGEVAQSVSNILQFVKSQQIEAQITDVFFSGLLKEELELCANSINLINPDLDSTDLSGGQVINVNCSSDDKYVCLGNFFYPVSGLIRTDKTFNMFAQFNKSSQKSEKKIAVKKKLRPIIALAAIAVLVFVVMLAWLIKDKIVLNALNEFNNREDVVAQCDEYDMITAEQETIDVYYQASERTWAYLDSYPLINDRMIAQLDRCAAGLVTLEVTGFDSTSGLLSFNATASDVEQINKFIRELKGQSMFTNIDYTGYVYQDKAAVWFVNVVCYLSGKAGR